MKTKHTNTLLIAVLILFAFSAFRSTTGQDPWDIPTKYKKMENPTDPTDREGIEIGKGIYMKHCKSCHGKGGEGDGSKAAELKTDCGDFTTAEFASQSDGELYYKSIIGRDEMPNYEKKIPNEEDRWLVINFMKSLSQ